MLGVRVESVTGETAKDLGIQEKEGVLVVDVVEGGNGDDAGLRRGDVIKEVNDRPVKDTLEYDAAIQRAKERSPQKPIVLLIKRGDSTRFIAVQPGE
jgi:S1-C subfamily serine protease